MRVKSRVLIVAAVAAALFGAGPAFASDDSPAGSGAPADSAPVEGPSPSAPDAAPSPGEGNGPVESEEPVPSPSEEPVPSPSAEPSPWPEAPPEWPGDADQAAPSAPIEEEPNYTG
ncbi:hypothetical protein [Nocardiopsis ganjiahuensis]|uniref:hypothetical protein n=1 Tax=Nocardiopsis ganjiahuensis TaxID=239984 RepID=UPI0007C723F5|nr:hypothetical protein [Nocardiopsis ganjiahuensis]